MSGVFITGTDTGCGKTSVGCALAAEIRARGHKLAVLKPVETGCEERDGDRRAEDALALAEAADDRRSAEQVCPYRFALPAAPTVAARAEGAEIELETIQRAYRGACEAAEIVLVEGAGGALVPVTESCDMLALASLLELPLLLVARAALGTINHTRLTLEAARQRGQQVLGVVISHTEPALTAADRANLDALISELGDRCLGELHHGDRQLTPASGFQTVLAQLTSSF